ncbi:MAG: O-antigen ligase family protein [Pseudobdellovibrio sp.]
MTKFISATKYLLLLNLLIIPFLVCGYNEQAPFELIKFVVTCMMTLLAGCLFLISFVKGREIKFSWNWQLVGLLGIGILTFVSYLYSNNQFDSFWGNNNIPSDSLLTMIIYSLFSFLLIQVIRDNEDLKHFNIILILSTFIGAAYGIVQHYGYDPVDWWGYSQMRSNAYGAIGQAVGYATILGSVFPLILMLYLAEKTKALRNILLLVVLAVLLGIMFSGSRMPMVLAIALSILVCAVYLFKVRTKDATKKVIGYLVVLALSQAIYYGENTDNALTHKLKPTVVATGLDERIQVWQDALKIWQKYPVLGSGPETFALELKLVNTKDFNSNQNWGLYWHKAHNHLIHFLATTGVVGLLGYLLFAGFIFYSIFKLTFKKKIEESDYLRLGYLLGYAFIFCANMTAFNFITTQLYGFIFPVLFGITYFDFEKKQFTIQSPRFLNVLNIVLCCALLGMLGNEIFKFWNSDRYFSLSRRYLEADHDMAKALQAIDKAIAIKDNDSRYYFRKASLVTSVIKYQAKNNPGLNYDGAVRDLDNMTVMGIKCDPKNPESWLFRGRLFEDLFENKIAKSSEIAEQAIKEGEKYSPANPVYPYQLGMVYLQNGRTVGFVDRMNDAIDLKYDYLPAYKALFKYYYDQKDQNEVNKLVKRILNTPYISGEFVRELIEIAQMASSHQDSATAEALKDVYNKFNQMHIDYEK